MRTYRRCVSSGLAVLTSWWGTPAPSLSIWRTEARQMTKVLRVAWILTVSLFSVFVCWGSLSVVSDLVRILPAVLLSLRQSHYYCPPRYCSPHPDQDYKLEILTPCWACLGFHLHQLRQVSPSINLKHLVKYERFQSGLLSIQMETRDDQWLADRRWIDILNFSTKYQSR